MFSTIEESRPYEFVSIHPLRVARQKPGNARSVEHRAPFTTPTPPDWPSYIEERSGETGRVSRLNSAETHARLGPTKHRKG